MKKLILLILIFPLITIAAEYPYKWSVIDKSGKHALGACVFIDANGQPTDTIYKLGVVTKDKKVFIAVAGNKAEVLSHLEYFKNYVGNFSEDVCVQKNYCNSEEHNPELRIEKYIVSQKGGKVTLARDGHEQTFKPKNFQKMIDKLAEFSL